jgi:hypothetical protein
MQWIQEINSNRPERITLSEISPPQGGEYENDSLLQ